MASAAPSGSSAPLDTQSLRDSYIPIFSGQPSDYREWRKRINLYYKKMVMTKRAGEAILNILGSFTGVVWRLFEDFPEDEIDKESAFTSILTTLDKHFAYDDRVQLPADFEGYFQGLNRKQGQTLLAYVTDHDEALRKVERHKVQLPVVVQGWHLLRRAHLSREQRQMVTLKAPTMEKNAVVEALFLLYGQDYKSGGHQPERRNTRWAGTRGYYAYAAGADWFEEDWDDEAYWGQVDDGDGVDEWYDYEGESAEFDQNAVYYQSEEADYVPDEADPSAMANEFDSVYATYVDARKRFQDLKLSRGFLPVVALQDNASQSSSPTRSPSKGGFGSGGSGKGSGGRHSGKGKNVVRYAPRPAGKGDIKARAQSALVCLRCGMEGHWAANCNQPPRSAAVKRPAPSSTEGMAVSSEEAHVLFQDERGHDRPDAVMLDPGASAFLSGYGPFKRFVEHLASVGYPVQELEMTRCNRRFQFGGDAASVSRWTVMLPLFIDDKFGKVQMYLLPGDTPMLCGRPVMEALGMAMDFQDRRIRFGQGPWHEATIGAHGEYLLSLSPVDSVETYDLANPHFELKTTEGIDGVPKMVKLADFNLEERVFLSTDKSSSKGVRLSKHFFKTAGIHLQTEANQLSAYVTKELHPQKEDSRRVLWEVYCGKARTSAIAESMGMAVETFSYESGWDFNLVEHQESFLRRQEAELPHEILLTPECRLWSQMQNLACRSELQKAELVANRKLHHDRHLMFGRKVYLSQVNGGRHCTVEQPKLALSWKTKAFRDLPGYRAEFDQCMYGCVCLSDDGRWLPSKKPTALQTTKRAVKEAFSMLCDGGHEHCSLEGSASGYGSRTKYLEDYQPCLAAVLAAALMVPEIPQCWDFVGAVAEQRKMTGDLVRLYTEQHAEAVRTVQRLHRNLGHPTPQALVDLLTARGASDAVLAVAKQYVCLSCSKYCKPNQVAPSSVHIVSEFNAEVQSDAFYIKIGSTKLAVLSIVDVGTRYMAAHLLKKEDSEEYILALEKAWVKHFGVPDVLVTDEGRPWLSSQFECWTSAQGITHKVAPGEAHERLALVERRHAILRRAVEVYLDDLGSSTSADVKEALRYVVPQVNAQPVVAGFSPTQWLLGKQPAVPGELLGDAVAAPHLGGNVDFEEMLKRRTRAKIALTSAEADQKLRRALLRKYQGMNQDYKLGEVVWFWRDARQADLVKIRWLGPARVVMKEEENGRVHTYWLAYKTQLIRCAPHHVRGDLLGREHAMDKINEAVQVLQQLKSRGVTRCLDLGRVNRQMLEDVESEDQVEAPDGDVADSEGEIGEPPAQRPRLLPFESPEVPEVRPESDYEPSLLQELPDGANAQGVEVRPEAAPARGVSEPMSEPSAAEPGSPSSAYAWPATNEDFNSHRLRVARQETLSLFGPWRHRAPVTAAPYSPPPPEVDAASVPVPEETDEALLSQAFHVLDVQPDALPGGWYMDEHGYLQLHQQEEDYWEVKSGCLIRHHVKPRRQKFSRESMPADCPLTADRLDPVRVTVVNEANGKTSIQTDDGYNNEEPVPRSWTGVTIFQINAPARKELAMYGQGPVHGVRKVAKDYKHAQAKRFKKENKGDLNERKMTPHERALFKEAKIKELKSFFEHQVWEFQTTREADPARTMTSRVLLKWSKNPDGSPRAKARLIVRGYTDPDALQGKVQTSSPTTTRLSRCMLMSLAANLSWELWTADVSTAFLQGKVQTRKLWVKLPAECNALLGGDESTRMLLLKPCYGQIDAPRGWYLEAVDRLLRLGLKQHPLDPCCFLMFEKEGMVDELSPSQMSVGCLGSYGLCGMIVLHVDDMLGAGFKESVHYQKVIGQLQNAFNLREWKDGKQLEYCGATIDQTG